MVATALARLALRDDRADFDEALFVESLRDWCHEHYATRALRRKALSSGVSLAVWRQTESEQSAWHAVAMLTGRWCQWNIHETEFVRGTDPVAAPPRGALKLLQFGAVHWAVIVEGYYVQSHYDYARHRGVKAFAVAHSDAMPIADVAAMPQLCDAEVEVWTIGTSHRCMMRYHRR